MIPDFGMAQSFTDGRVSLPVIRAAMISAAFLLDLLMGDPLWLPHPVVLMGRLITWLERCLRSIFPRTRAGERRAGMVLAAALPLGTLGIAEGTLIVAGRLHPWARFALETFWCYQALAVRGMIRESGRVYDALRTDFVAEMRAEGSIEQTGGSRSEVRAADSLLEARRAVGRIVGRDTARLDRTGIAAAAVESVAESFHDGVAAPLLYMALGGAPLALAYKAVNTMDSMVGYRNKRYLDFGRGAARLDDAANYLPSRLGALLLMGAAALAGADGKGAYRIWRRDRRKHDSPNAAQTEAVMAGALGIRLGGGAYYGGVFHERPVLGAEGRDPEAEEILRANRIFLWAGTLGTAVACFLLLWTAWIWAAVG